MPDVWTSHVSPGHVSWIRLEVYNPRVGSAQFRANTPFYRIIQGM
jgi:hypothetical protein